jgi:hypothetical protein
MVAIWRGEASGRGPAPVKRALYTEDCRDEDGRRYRVVVWREWSASPKTSYSLEDGTPLHYEDECSFALPSGKFLTRCADDA